VWRINVTKKTDSDEYERHRQTMAEISREKSAKGRDIGEIPPVVNTQRKSLCRNDLKLFLESYLPALFPLSWASFHLTAIERLERLILNGGLFANSLPRGSGKSALFVGAIIWCGVYGHRSYAAVVCAIDDLATDFIQDIKTQLEGAGPLADDFPEVCYPIKCLERLTARCRGQTCGGAATRIEWTSDTIVLPTIPGSPASGFRVTAAGITGAIRGLKFTRADGSMVRPSFVLIDDPQTNESAKSIMQTGDRIDITDGAILGLAGPGETMAAAMAVTVIRKGDYSDHYLGTVDWQGQRQGLLDKMPGKETLLAWSEYREVQKEALAQGLGVGPQNEFYAANRARLDADLVATWPDRYDQTNELSAIQSAINLYFKVGSKKFAAEYMNQPEALSDGDVYKLDPASVRQRLTGLQRLTIPQGYDFLTVGVDIQMRLIWYAVTAWKMDMTGSVIDYGWLPQQPRREFTLDELGKTLQSESGAIDADVDAAVSWGLMRLGEQVLSRQYIREDGQEIFIPAGQIDINWRPSESAVARFCRTSKYKAIMMPGVGVGMLRNRRRISEWAKRDNETHPRPEDRRECEWMVTARKQHGVRECHFDPNHWKSFVNTALSLPMYSPGALSLYGEKEAEHVMLGQHVTSHYPINVTFGASSQVQWSLRPGVDRDDLLDCLVGCAVAASRHGARLTRVATALPVDKAQTGRRTFHLPGGKR
jgi:hypothetical protein